MTKFGYPNLREAMFFGLWRSLHMIWDRVEDQRLVVDTLLVAETLSARVNRDDVWGVGLFQYYNGLTPGVVLDGSGASPDELGILNARRLEDEELLIAIRFRLGADPGKWLAIRVPEPVLLFSPGDAIDAGNPLNFSTAGARAQWYDAKANTVREGFITAGHGFSPNATVNDASGVNIGTVVHHEFAVAGNRTPAADVSLVYSRPVAQPGSLPPFFGRTSAVPPDAIDIHAPVPKTDTVGGILKSFYVKSARITLGDLYMTQAGRTTGGDSGAAVTVQSSATNTLIGHVVAADPKYASYVQDIDFEIAAISSFALVTV